MLSDNSPTACIAFFENPYRLFTDSQTDTLVPETKEPL